MAHDSFPRTTGKTDYPNGILKGYDPKLFVRQRVPGEVEPLAVIDRCELHNLFAELPVLASSKRPYASTVDKLQRSLRFARRPPLRPVMIFTFLDLILNPFPKTSPKHLLCAPFVERRTAQRPAPLFFSLPAVPFVVRNLRRDHTLSFVQTSGLDPGALECSFDLLQQRLGSYWLVQEGGSASLHCQIADRAVAVSADKYNRNLFSGVEKPLLEFHAVHPGEMNIEDQTAHFFSLRKLKESFCTRKSVDGETRCH